MVKSFQQMRNVALMLLSAFFLACENPSNVLLDVSGTQPLQTFYTDSLSIQRSTMLLDSSSTSFQPQVVVGGFDDAVLGYTQAVAYLQPSLPVDNTIGTIAFTAGENPVADSAFVELLSSGYYVGDTTQRIVLSLHRLTQAVDPSKYYSNQAKLPYEATPITSARFLVDNLFTSAKRDTLKSLKMYLPLSIAEEILKTSGTDAGKTNAAFAAAVKGFALVVNGKPLGLYGFRTGGTTGTASKLRLYYHKAGETTSKNAYFDFGGQRFSRIEVDRTTGRLPGLTELRKPISSLVTNGITYVQSGTGLTTKFHMPTLSNLPKGALINSATLTLAIDTTIFAKKLQPLSAIALGVVDDNNYLIQGKYRFVSPSITGVPIAGLYNTTTKVYLIDVTQYVQNIVNGLQTHKSLVVLPATYNSDGTATLTNATLNRIAIKSSALKVYYSVK